MIVERRACSAMVIRRGTTLRSQATSTAGMPLVSSKQPAEMRFTPEDSRGRTAGGELEHYQVTKQAAAGGGSCKQPRAGPYPRAAPGA